MNARDRALKVDAARGELERVCLEFAERRSVGSDEEYLRRSFSSAEALRALRAAIALGDALRIKVTE